MNLAPVVYKEKRLTFALPRLWTSIVTGLLFLLAADGIVVSAQEADPPPVSTLSDVPRAVVRIDAIGEYQSLNSRERATSVTGTGFLIHPSGLIVTNNHVAAGSRSLAVHVSGEDRPYHGTLVALSECSDLALININGSAFPYLDWKSSSSKIRDTVYAFGFASGELRRSVGVIEEIVSDFDSNIISSQETILHSAAIAPGDSGGPLTDGQGRVIGVNYGTNRRGRGSAVSATEAQSTVRRLQQSPRSESFGLNGEVWRSLGLSGVWITAVQPSSPAAAAGLVVGEILTDLDGKALAGDGSMAGYCSTLRGWDGTGALDFQVIRGRETAKRTGQLTPVVPSALSADLSFRHHRLGETELLLPALWSDIEVNPEPEEQSISLRAAPDLAIYQEAISGPMVEIEIIDGFTTFDNPGGYLDSLDLSKFCGGRSRSAHIHLADETTYEGSYDIWSDCFGESIRLYVLILHSRPNSQLFLARFFSRTRQDDLAFRVLRHSLRPLSTSVEESLASVGEAQVVVTALNLRSGPGLIFNRISSVVQGELLEIEGRNSDCSWLRVVTPGGRRGWVSAAPVYLSFTTSCSAIPLISG